MDRSFVPAPYSYFKPANRVVNSGCVMVSQNPQNGPAWLPSPSTYNIQPAKAGEMHAQRVYPNIDTIPRHKRKEDAAKDGPGLFV